MCISDKEITSRRGFPHLLNEGDEIMADKGFTIRHLLQSKKAILVIPPFRGKRDMFSKHDVAETHEIARLRIHVEHAIRRVKEIPEFSRLRRYVVDSVYRAHNQDLGKNVEYGREYGREYKEKCRAYRANMRDGKKLIFYLLFFIIRRQARQIWWRRVAPIPAYL